jgi:3-isopropylmalate dehydrogenase
MRAVFDGVAAEFPGVDSGHHYVDAMALDMLRRPWTFDVLPTENMFGDILSDLTGELVGSLGTAGSINAGDEAAMAQAAHGSAPDIAGQDLANPIGMMVSGWQLLRWLADRHDDAALADVADRCETGMLRALEAGHRTRDLGGSLGCSAFSDQVVAHLP